MYPWNHKSTKSNTLECLHSVTHGNSNTRLHTLKLSQLHTVSTRFLQRFQKEKKESVTSHSSMGEIAAAIMQYAACLQSTGAGV